MAKPNICDTAIKAVHSFSEFNEKYLVSLLWTSIAGLITLAAYGGLTNNPRLVLQAGLLVPVGSYVAFGANYFIGEKPRSFYAFSLSCPPLLIFIFSFVVMLSILPFIFQEIEQNNPALIGSDFFVYSYFGTFYEAIMFYLVVAYSIQWVGVCLKWSK